MRAMMSALACLLAVSGLVLVSCGTEEEDPFDPTPFVQRLADPAMPLMSRGSVQMELPLDWGDGWTPQGRWGAEGDLGGDGGYKSGWPCLICENMEEIFIPPPPQYWLPPSMLPPPEPKLFYLSADDSNSQASPTHARWLIERGKWVDASRIRIWEFLNYYDFSYTPPSGQALAVTQQLRPYDFDEGIYALQIGLQGRVVQTMRRPLNVTFSLDTSGSMSGEAIELLKEVCWTIAGQLQEGDRVSMVNWSTTQSTLLDSLEVSGPWDPDLVDAIIGLGTGGGTDLHSGLVAAYALAEANHIEDGMNRVVLISDGGANVGITDEQLIAEHAEVAEGEAIYLVGVGVAKSSYSYNDSLMDTVTDLGKGAYVFVDSQDEARHAFGENFLANLEIIARDVQVELTLPPYFDMHEFFGEEYSQDADDVEPQHLAPNDAMVYQQLIATTQPGSVGADEEIAVRVTYTDALTGDVEEASATRAMQDLVDGPCDELRKGDAIVVYAQALGRVTDLVGNGEYALAAIECLGALAIVHEAFEELEDPDLEEIADLLDSYCGQIPG